MASTKRKRRTKHRGNAAGMVETRGRTGRKPTASETKSTAKKGTQRPNRFDSPPTWRSALNRALLATGLFVVIVAVLFRQNIGVAVSLAAFMLVLYVPLGYYTDLMIYRRRQRKKLEGKIR